MYDRKVKQIHQIINSEGILGFLKLVSDVINHKVITENADPKSRLASFDRDFLEFYKLWHYIDNIGFNQGQL